MVINPLRSSHLIAYPLSVAANEIARAIDYSSCNRLLIGSGTLVFFTNLKLNGTAGQFISHFFLFFSNRQFFMVLNENPSHEYPMNARVPLGSFFSPTLFLLYNNDIPDNAIYAVDTTRYSKYDRVCGNSLCWLFNLNLSFETLQTGIESSLLRSMLGKLNLLFYLLVQITQVLQI